ncbi:GAF domain-containing protein [candidate division KSB1 bacterium]|nr:GAF domain-containing protein [candidate division KSB1 bacterium]
MNSTSAPQLSDTQRVNTVNDPWIRILDQFMDELNDTVEFESGSLFLFEDGTESLKEAASKGDGIDFISSVSFPMGLGLSAWVAQKGKMVYLPDIHRGSRHGLNPVRSYLSLPLEIHNRIIGVLNLGHTVPDAFSNCKLKKIQDLSKRITRKIYNRMYLGFNSDDSTDFVD